MQTLLIVNSLLSQGLGQGNDHRTAAHTGFVRADKFLFLDQMLGIMHEHLGHDLTHRVRREKLAALFVMKFEPVVQHAEHIGGLILQARHEHTQEWRELLELFGLVLRDDGEVLRFSGGFIDRIGSVAEGDGGELNEVPENGEGVMAVGELADGVFEGGKVVARRLRGRLCAGLGRHNAPLSKGKKIPPRSSVTEGVLVKGTLMYIVWVRPDPSRGALLSHRFVSHA